MDEQTETLKSYISAQLQAGQTPNEILAQLTAAGWSTEHINQAFLAIQAAVVPTHMQQPSARQAGPQAFGKRRGRIRTGWVLFKQSLRILNSNRYLFRYLLMPWIFIISIEAIIFVIVYFAGGSKTFTNGQRGNTWQWYVFVVISYVIIIFTINFYAAALSATMLDIFQGQRKPYAVYIGAARSKFWPILVFSLFSAGVGFFLRYVIERIRWLGWILAWLLGTAWSLGTIFVLPIIMNSDYSVPLSIKQSVKFFKQTWGESVIAKVSVNAPLALLNVLFLLVFILLLIPAVVAGSVVAVFVLFIIYLFLAISLGILGSFANSLVNMALYYFAVRSVAPPGFSSDMLNQVFIKRKKHRLFQKGNPESTV